MRTKLTKNLTLEEMIRSDYAIRHNISNIPNEDQTFNLKQLCTEILQPLRDYLQIPIFIISGFRCLAVNIGIGGSKDSQHTEGKAADIVILNMRTIDVIEAIVELKLPFDQLIDEFEIWTHVSLDPNLNRRQILQATKIGTMTAYSILKI